MLKHYSIKKNREQRQWHRWGWLNARKKAAVRFLPADNYFGLWHLYNMENFPNAHIKPTQSKSTQVIPNKFNMRRECVKLPQWKLLLHCCHLTSYIHVCVCVCFKMFKLDLSLLSAVRMWLRFFLSFPLFNLIDRLFLCVRARLAIKIIWYLLWKKHSVYHFIWSLETTNQTLSNVQQILA